MTLTDLIFRMILNSLHGYLVTVEGRNERCEVIRSNDLQAIGTECWEQREFTLFVSQQRGEWFHERAVIHFDLDADFSKCIVSADDQRPEEDYGYISDILSSALSAQRLFAKEFAR